MTDFYSTPIPGYKVNISDEWKEKNMDVSMVQGLEEHPGDLDSGFVWPQSLYEPRGITIPGMI